VQIEDPILLGPLTTALSILEPWSICCASRVSWPCRPRGRSLIFEYLSHTLFLGKADVYWNRQVINGCAWAGWIFPVPSVSGLPLNQYRQFGSNCSATSRGRLLQRSVQSESCQAGLVPPHYIQTTVQLFH
jgi:hypothetical protein